MSKLALRLVDICSIGLVGASLGAQVAELKNS